MRPMVRLCVLLALTVGGLWPGMARSQDFAVLAYHDVVDDTGGLTYDGITLRNLAMHFDWLRANGYRVVSVDDLLAARDGRRPLPSRAVLLTFDDGYRSFYTHVYPLLQAFSYPAVFSVVGSFLDAPPQAQVRYGAILVAREDFVSWAELREMQRSGLVEVASHTYALHSTIFTNPQGGEVPAATGQRFIRRLKGPQVREQSLVHLPRPTFGDVRALMALRFQQYLRVAVRLADAAIDYAYDPRTGRYETDQEHRQRIKRDLERNSDLLQAKLGLRPRVISWPFGRWNEAAAAVAREVGMPIGLTLDAERTDLKDLGRIGRFYAAQNPDLQFVASAVAQPPEPELLRGLCVNLDEVFAPSEEEQEARLGRILDRILAFRPTAVLLAAASSDPGGGVYFPNDRLPVRADLFSRVAWQLRTRTGSDVYAWLAPDQAGSDADTAAAVYAAMARSVPFRGLSLGPAFLAGDLRPRGLEPGWSRWDPRTPRRVREAEDPAGLSDRARRALGLVETVTRYQPAARLLDVVDLPRLGRPAETAIDAVDYLAVRWDGAAEEAVRKLGELGWGAGDHGRLVYWSSRGAPAEWRRVQRAGIINSVYCPDRLLDRPAELAAMGEVAGGASYPFRP